ncbi:MAG TPA: DUF4038 domain-containing protein [Limnochordia bacterium]
MSSIRIADTRDRFIRDGRPWFYLADTAWSAFTSATLEEWEAYLDYRRLQGFNALQIDILSQWDRSESTYNIHPFRVRDDGTYDFHEINHEYFQRARQMMEMAVARGFVPALVVLWCNYVQGTWANKRKPQDRIPFELVKPYVEHVVDVFQRFDPIYVVSGDTDFNEESIPYYRTALEVIDARAPEALTTLHLSPPTDWPAEFVDSPRLDFYMYQSGHSKDSDNPYRLAEKFRRLPVKRPIVNGEPPYEGHGHGHRYGRFDAFDVRRAIWQSLLSGAKAGVTYGAHGVWSWHRKGMHFPSAAFSSWPFEWDTALRFPGAWDAAFAKSVFETHDLFDLEPMQEALVNENPEIRVAAAPDQSTVAIYLPYSTDVVLNIDLSSHEWRLITLSDRRVAVPAVEATPGGSRIRMHPFNDDVLLLGQR